MVCLGFDWLIKFHSKYELTGKFCVNYFPIPLSDENATPVTLFFTYFIFLQKPHSININTNNNHANTNPNNSNENVSGGQSQYSDVEWEGSLLCCLFVEFIHQCVCLVCFVNWYISSQNMNCRKLHLILCSNWVRYYHLLSFSCYYYKWITIFLSFQIQKASPQPSQQLTITTIPICPSRL